MGPNPGLGGAMQPQAGAVQQGLPPASPQEHAELTDRWHRFFTNPAVSAGLFQFGASMLSNMGRNAPLGQRVGLSLSDAGRSVGGAAKFQADQQSEVARQAAEQTRLGQGQEGIELEKSGQAQRGQIADREAALREKTLTQTSADAAADRSLRLQELQGNNEYRKLALGLQKEQLQSTLLGMQTPRGRALLALQKSAMDSMELGDQNFDLDTYINNGLKTIDQMFGPAGASAVAAPSADGAPVPPAGASPAASPAAPPAAGAYTPENPMPGALPFDQAAKILKSQPTPENVKDFETVYGPGSAKKAGVTTP